MTQVLPPPAPSANQQHLKIIEIFHYVMCGLALGGMAFLFVHYMIMSTAFFDPHMWEKANPPPPFDPTKFFHAFVWFYLFMAAWGALSLAGNLISGLCIRCRKARFFSLLVAGFNCINFPFGTGLGIFTLIVLVRPSVQGLYGKPQAH